MFGLQMSIYKPNSNRSVYCSAAMCHFKEEIEFDFALTCVSCVITLTCFVYRFQTCIGGVHYETPASCYSPRFMYNVYAQVCQQIEIKKCSEKLCATHGRL